MKTTTSVKAGATGIIVVGSKVKALVKGSSG